jgi:hypothetical protein
MTNTEYWLPISRIYLDELEANIGPFRAQLRADFLADLEQFLSE